MHMSRVRLLVLSLLLLALAAPAAAGAATPNATLPGAWTRVSDRAGSPTDAPSLARDSNGVLHLVYTAQAATDSIALRSRDLASAGTWGVPLTIVRGWRSLAAPDVLSIGSATYAFWAGREPAGTPTSGSGTAWSAQLTGKQWTRLLVPSTQASGPADATTLSATADLSGEPWLGWSTSGIFGLHAGFAGSSFETQTPTVCCELGTNLELDRSSNEIYEVTRSTAPATAGTTLRRVAPSRGDAVVLTESSFQGSSVARSTRIATATRATGAGVYVGYCAAVPKCTKLRVTDQFQRSLALALKVPARPESVAVASAPDGRLWLTWTDIKQTVWATRSNRAATRWGSPTHMPGPAGMTSAGHATVSGSAGPLDLVLNATTRGSSWLWYTRLRPGLTLAPLAPVVRDGSMKVVRVHVSDAGEKVRAVVTFRGAKRTTNAQGVATIIIPPDTSPGRYPISVSSFGYSGASGTLVVR
jgi:hypothetical protein